MCIRDSLTLINNVHRGDNAASNYTVFGKWSQPTTFWLLMFCAICEYKFTVYARSVNTFPETTVQVLQLRDRTRVSVTSGKLGLRPPPHLPRFVKEVLANFY